MPSGGGGNVNIRFSVQDAEVVRKALEQLGKDGEQALRRIDAASRTPSTGLRAVAEAIAQLKDRLTDATTTLGAFGNVLRSMGTVGLATGAVLGTVYLAFQKLSQLADERSNKALALRSFSLTTGFTTDQVQGATDAAAKHGVTLEETRSAIQRFTIAWADMRKGGGDLAEEINKIDPVLSRQIKQARDSATAFDLFAKAVSRVDVETRNALLKAAGGRGGVGALTGLVAATNEAGGLNNLAAQNRLQGGVIDPASVESLSKLRTEIDASGDRIRDKIASWFSTPILENQKRARSEIESIVDAITRFSPSQAWTDFWDNWKAYAAANDTGRAPLRIRVGPSSASPIGNPPLPPSRPAAADQAPRTSEDILKQSRDTIAILGSAATQTEILSHRRLELADATKRAGVSSEYAKRAEADLVFIQRQSNEATRESFGVSTEAEIALSRRADLYDRLGKGVTMTSQQIADAERVIQIESRRSAEALEVRRSALPNLKQLDIDARDPVRNLDRIGTDVAGQVSTGFAQMTTSAKGFSDGLKSLGTTVTQTIAEVVYRMTIGRLVANAFTAAFSAFMPAAGNTAGNPMAGAPADFTGVRTAHGGAFGPAGMFRFARGGIVNRPTFFPFASGTGLMGEAGPEAIMPLRRNSAGDLGVVAGGGRAANRVEVHVNTMPGNTMEETSRSSGDGVDQIELTERRIDRSLAQGRFDGSMRRYNARPPVQRW